MHNNTTIVPYVSLCSGYEGIGLGLHRCIPNLRCIAYCEREAFAVANLVAKMENGLLDAAPVFTDVTTFPWEQYAPYMAGGILSFGWPCQPVSCAGKRKATEDERWLFDIIADGIALMRPGLLFAENVEGLLSAKMPDGSLVFAHCIERLESLHYKVAAGIFSASEVGAPHQRKRVFILAYRSSEGLQGCILGAKPRIEAAQLVAGRCSEVADSETARLYGHDSTAATRTWRCDTKHAEISGDSWPSRPGEPQFAWEPPRVVGAGLAHTGSLGRRGRSDGDAGGLRGQIQTAGSCGGGAETMGNAAQRDGVDASRIRRALERQSRRRVDSDPSVEGGAMGNAASDGRQHDQQPAQGRRAATVAESSQCDLGNADHGRLASGINAGSGTEADRRGQGDIEQAEPWQVERTMGLHSHGTSDGLGHAELSGLCDSELAEIREWMVKCDNRTDELRLLGNGVVPATAERAFKTLMEELQK